MRAADAIPVTVCLTPSKAARLEVIIAQQREINPVLDDNALCDLIFLRGMQSFERRPAQAVAGENAELLFEQILAQGDYITRLLDRISAMKTELAAALDQVRTAREPA